MPTANTKKLVNTSAREDRFPVDSTLRRFGFQIVSRPSKGPVIWRLEGVEYTEAEAIRWVEGQVKSVESC